MTTFTFYGFTIESDDCVEIHDLIPKLETALLLINMRMDYASVAKSTDIVVEDPAQLSLDLTAIDGTPIELQLWRELHGI